MLLESRLSRAIRVSLVMARLYLKKTLTGFAPADEASQELVKKFKLGEVYKADVVKPRSYRNHKLIFAMLSLTFENQDQYKDFETFRKAVAIEAGHTEEIITPSGEIYRIPKSISYDALDQIAFTKVSAEMMAVCCSMLHGVGADELEAEISRYAA